MGKLRGDPEKHLIEASNLYAVLNLQLDQEYSSTFCASQFHMLRDLIEGFLTWNHCADQGGACMQVVSDYSAQVKAGEKFEDGCLNVRFGAKTKWTSTGTQ